MAKIADRAVRRRGAILSMELVLILPLFLLLIFSIIEFSMLMSARTRVAAAASGGARRMTISGGGADDIRTHVEYLLGPDLARNCVISVEPGETAGSVGRVRVQVPMSNASPDLLWIAGYGLKNRRIEAEAPMIMERAAGRESRPRY